MFTLDIPGFGPIQLQYLVSDFTGTLSVDGKLLDGVRERLNRIGGFLEVHFLTADTFGKAREELKDLQGSRVHILSGEGHDKQKEEYVKRLGPEKTIAFGNGNNDRLMLKAAKIGVAVATGEGCAVDALRAADIFVPHIIEGLELLLNPKRLKATLRF